MIGDMSISHATDLQGSAGFSPSVVAAISLCGGKFHACSSLRGVRTISSVRRAGETFIFHSVDDYDLP